MECLKTETSGIYARVLVFVCVNLRAKMRVSVLDDYRSRILLALLIGSNRIWPINPNAKQRKDKFVRVYMNAYNGSGEIAPLPHNFGTSCK
jgi:hypothetical protein